MGSVSRVEQFDDSSGEYQNAKVIATGVGAAKAAKGLAAAGAAAYRGLKSLADEAAKAADEAVTLFHGSAKHADEILDSGLDVNRSGATYVSPDVAAAQDAIEARKALGEATNPGIITSRVPRSEVEALINSGDIGVRPYKGFYPYRLNTVEYLLKTPAAKELFNRGIQR
jgi:hypothetical protein